MLIPQSEIDAAYLRIQPYLKPTPLIHSEYYSKFFSADIYFKLEVLQPTHSFKVRGTFNAILTLPLEKKAKNVITASGGGGLISGIASSAHIYFPNAKISGIETKGADCLSQSLKAKQIVALAAITSVAESLGAKKTEERHFHIISHYIDQVAVVTDKQAITEIFNILQNEKILLEPAASCVLAAMTTGKIHVKKEDKVVAVICGANVAFEKILMWYDQYLPAKKFR